MTPYVNVKRSSDARRESSLVMRLNELYELMRRVATMECGIIRLPLNSEFHGSLSTKLLRIINFVQMYFRHLSGHTSLNYTEMERDVTVGVNDRNCDRDTLLCSSKCVFYCKRGKKRWHLRRYPVSNLRIKRGQTSRPIEKCLSSRNDIGSAAFVEVPFNQYAGSLVSEIQISSTTRVFHLLRLLLSDVSSTVKSWPNRVSLFLSRSFSRRLFSGSCPSSFQPIDSYTTQRGYIGFQHIYIFHAKSTVYVDAVWGWRTRDEISRRRNSFRRLADRTPGCDVTFAEDDNERREQPQVQRRDTRLSGTER